MKSRKRADVSAPDFEREHGPDRGPDVVRRRITTAIAIGALVPTLRVHAAGEPMEVWTGPSCSCCHDWVAYLEANGFSITKHDGGNGDARTRLGIPVRYGSCHTGEVAGYAIEGHVPAREIHRLLEERPDAIGLSVPAMPRGSPGMDAPIYGGAQDPYDVLLIHRDGSAMVYQSYRDAETQPIEQPSAAEHSAQGTLDSVDVASGTVSISHGAIASASWPAMTMSFKVADSAQLADLRPGERVEFHFTIEGGMNATVTRISKID